MPADEDWPPDVDALAARIAARAKEPVDLPDCFIEWLRTYFLEASPEEARQQWSESARLAFWVCLDHLRCVDAVLADPPENLIEMMQENGSVVLYHRDAVPWHPYSKAEYLDWLRNVRKEFGKIVEDATSASEE